VGLSGPSRFFEGKNVVLTGGSSGIGRAIAVDLARQGANLLLIGRRQALLDETIVLLESTRHDTAPIWESRAVDVSQRVAIQSALQTYDEGHPVDILINCAGIAWAEYVDRMPPEAFEQTIQINYLGTVWSSLALIPSFKRRRSGIIANVASLAGVLGFIGNAAYSPSKFAVVGFSEAIRSELRSHNVRVCLLLPPDTATPQLEAENLTRPSETRAVAEHARILQPAHVSRVFLEGIAAGRFRIVPGWDAKLTDHASRHVPGLMRWIMDRLVASSRRRSNLMSSPDHSSR
jgi:3-dehydrosphinganine reductase